MRPPDILPDSAAESPEARRTRAWLARLLPVDPPPGLGARVLAAADLRPEGPSARPACPSWVQRTAAAAAAILLAAGLLGAARAGSAGPRGEGGPAAGRPFRVVDDPALGSGLAAWSEPTTGDSLPAWSGTAPDRGP